ncbi:serine/threonine protein kinase [Pendulispora brunnea]|uniref:Serine/threonine protein kinase n=1 Tax=Pendulispora brunnea TaxID=2905690 RepID=A0ABZ2JXA9_9BACT
MLAVGDLFLGKYRIERMIGAGGMGAVYAAKDIDLARRVAIKVLLPEIANVPQAATRFVNEGRVAARVEGEHVARVYAAGHTPEGIPYMVLELLEGMDLAELLQRRGRLPVGEAVDILLQALQGVAEAHRHGIVHRDLKPANVFLHRRADGSEVVKVLDFGVSKVYGVEGLTTTETMIGSPEYMSPEQVVHAKSVDHRTDIWSIGVILYEMLTGVTPFIDNSLSGTIMAVMHRTPHPVRQLRPDVPAGLEAVLAHCLERDLSRRVADVTTLAHWLASFASAAMSAAPPTVREPEPAPYSAEMKTQIWIPPDPAPAPAPALEPAKPKPTFRAHLPFVVMIILSLAVLGLAGFRFLRHH